VVLIDGGELYSVVSRKLAAGEVSTDVLIANLSSLSYYTVTLAKK